MRGICNPIIRYIRATERSELSTGSPFGCRPDNRGCGPAGSPGQTHDPDFDMTKVFPCHERIVARTISFDFSPNCGSNGYKCYGVINKLAARWTGALGFVVCWQYHPPDARARIDRRRTFHDHRAPRGPRSHRPPVRMPATRCPSSSRPTTKRRTSTRPSTTRRPSPRTPLFGIRDHRRRRRLDRPHRPNWSEASAAPAPAGAPGPARHQPRVRAGPALGIRRRPPRLHVLHRQPTTSST